MKRNQSLLILVKRYLNPFMNCTQGYEHPECMEACGDCERFRTLLLHLTGKVNVARWVRVIDANRFNPCSGCYAGEMGKEQKYETCEFAKAGKCEQRKVYDKLVLWWAEYKQ